MLFFLLINVKMSAIVGILTSMGRQKSCMKKYNLGARTLLIQMNPLSTTYFTEEERYSHLTLIDLFACHRPVQTKLMFSTSAGGNFSRLSSVT